MKVFIVIVFIFIVIELGIFTLVRWLRKGFPWLIIAKDHHPVLNESKVNDFMRYSFDDVLGWVRRPNTDKEEKSQQGGITKFHINNIGARYNPGFEGKKALALVFGDSYTFARQVNDHETWTHIVSKELKINIHNFGVGNYGLDQVNLRMKRELPKFSPKIVIFGVVPETICRIQAFWKHYSEYGNTFAFKPRYILDGQGNLKLKLNPVCINRKLVKYRDYESELHKLDRFYKDKFLKDMLRFPYSFHLLRSAKRNIPLIFSLLNSKFSSNSRIQRLPFQMVLNRNHMISYKMYQEEASLQLMEKLIINGVDFVKQHNGVPIFCLFPQLQDIRIMKTKGFFYHTILNRIDKYVKIIDFGESFINLDPIEDYYTDDMWGGHFSIRANEIIGKKIADHLKEIMSSSELNINNFNYESKMN